MLGTKVVIVGTDGVATQTFVSLLIENLDRKIAVSDAESSQYADWYRAHDIENIPVFEVGPKILRGIKLIGGFSRLVCLIARYRGIRDIDVLHIQGMWPETLLLMEASGLRARHTVCSFWGSDLLRLKNAFKPIVRQWMDKADIVTVQDRVTMKSAFHTIWGNRYDDKLRGVLYDVENREIDNLVEKIDALEAKSRLGIDPQKYTIAIGYNANPNMHHIAVLEQLSKLPQNVLERIHLIFPFTYPNGNDEYRQTIKRFVESMPCSASYFEGWLEEDEVALMRLACDMFVHAQTSDAASASVIEFLKAGASLVNAQWIDYRELKDLGVSYCEFSSFDQLPGIIGQLMNDPNASTIAKRNREILRARDERSLSRDAWISIYNELK